MAVRGIRGAIDVKKNDKGEILAAAAELLERIVKENGLQKDDIACVYFTATTDLDAVYPAAAARRMGWSHVPLMCVQEMVVPGSLDHCLRVMVLWNTEVEASAIRHVYLGRAASLRPDLVLE